MRGLEDVAFGSSSQDCGANYILDGKIGWIGAWRGRGEIGDGGCGFVSFDMVATRLCGGIYDESLIDGPVVKGERHKRETQ